MPSDLKLSVQSVTPDVTLTLSDPYIGSAYSPQVDVSEIEGGHEVTITHKSPSGIVTDTFDVLDGVDGTDGVDGVSPTVEIESTSDAHTITITDADGAHSYTVDTYADEEAARATAESSRVAAESSRVTAEQARATAESSRAAAESARVTAEASRATAEQTRAAAESSRAEAEQARATAETARATAESARATAEQGRATAEQARATAETARASAESGRVSAETARVSAENARASAESARATAESARASAETSRATAETARASAETARATEWAEIESDAQGAITAAQSATQSANDAAAEASLVNATASKSGSVATVTVTDRTGTEHSVELYDATIVDGSVTTAKLANGSITDAKLAQTGGVLTNKVDIATERMYYGSVTRGKWVQSNGNDYTRADGQCLEASVEPSERYYACGVIVNSSFPLIVFFDENDSVIGVEGTVGDFTVVNDYAFTTPANCVKVKINGRDITQAVGNNYPKLYQIVNAEQTGNDIAAGIASKQDGVTNWVKATYESDVDKYALLPNTSVVSISSNFADNYSYAKLRYDSTKRYRFFGVTRSEHIPAVICCDSNNVAIKVYETTQTTIIAKEYDDIPQNTYYIYVNGYSTSKARIEVATERDIASLDGGKVGVFFGDSITQGANVYQFNAAPYQDYPTIAGDALGCTAYNGGLGGGTWASGRTIDFKNVVDCVVSGDFSSVFDGITQYRLNGGATNNYQKIAALDFSKVDFVSIALGTNDWNFGNSAANVKTAIEYCLEKLMTNFPNLRIYIFTPIYRFNVNGSGEDADVYVNTDSGLTLHQMCESIIDTVKTYHVPCKDMFYTCNINSFNKSTFMGDDTHPNAEGYTLLGEKFAKFINAN